MWGVTPGLPIGAAKSGGYKQLYPQDKDGDEMGEYARVWSIYNDESDRIDAEMVATWTATLDTLLIFAGLFSAVVATFVTLTTQSLQPDFTEVTASLLTEIASLQRAALLGGNITMVPISPLTHNTAFIPTTRDIYLNGIWIVSLGLTLATALITGMIKQWLQFYITDVTGPSPRDRASIRQFRYMGLSLWAVSPIIEFLPILMGSSLLLFFVGLVLFSQTLSGSRGITIVVIMMTCSLFVFYLGSSLLPLWKPQCPYKTSVSAVVSLGGTVMDLIPSLRRRSGSLRSDRDSSLSIWRRIGIELRRRRSAMSESERDEVQMLKERLLVEAVSDMVTSSTNPVVAEIALHSLAGLPTTTAASHVPDYIWAKIRSSLTTLSAEQTDEEKDATTRLYRALILCPKISSGDLTVIHRFATTAPPDDNRASSLLGSIILTMDGVPFQASDFSQDFFKKRFYRQPPFNRRLLPTLIRHDISQNFSTLFDLMDFDQALLHLAANLSKDKAPTLPEEIMLQGLYHQMFAQERSDRTFSTALASGDHLYSLFFSILPEVVKQSLESSPTNCDPMYQALIDVLSKYRAPPRGKTARSLRHDRSEDQRSRLLMIMNRISQTEYGDVSTKQGTVALRLKATLTLHGLLFGKAGSVFHAPTIRSFIRALTLMDPKASDPASRDHESFNTLLVFFTNIAAYSPGVVFEAIDKFVFTEDLLDLHENLVKCMEVTVHLSIEVGGRSPRVVLAKLDALFKYFLDMVPQGLTLSLRVENGPWRSVLALIHTLEYAWTHCLRSPSPTHREVAFLWSRLVASWHRMMFGRLAHTGRIPDSFIMPDGFIPIAPVDQPILMPPPHEQDFRHEAPAVGMTGFIPPPQARSTAGFVPPPIRSTERFAEPARRMSEPHSEDDSDGVIPTALSDSPFIMPKHKQEFGRDPFAFPTMGFIPPPPGQPTERSANSTNGMYQPNSNHGHDVVKPTTTTTLDQPFIFPSHETFATPWSGFIPPPPPSPPARFPGEVAETEEESELVLDNLAFQTKASSKANQKDRSQPIGTVYPLYELVKAVEEMCHRVSLLVPLPNDQSLEDSGESHHEFDAFTVSSLDLEEGARDAPES